MHTTNKTILATMLAVSLGMTTVAHAQSTQTSGTGGYSAACDAAIDANAQLIPCAENYTPLNGAQAIGGDAVAVGVSANAEGLRSVAVGSLAASAGDQGVAIGPFASANTHTAVAIGGGTVAGDINGDGEVAIGGSASATGKSSIAIGDNSYARGDGAAAMGVYAGAVGDQSVAFGNAAAGIGAGSVALGSSAYVGADGSVAIGSTATVDPTADNSIAIGPYAAAHAAYTVAIGGSALNTALTVGGVTYQATSNEATMLGYGAQVASDYDTALGSGANVFYGAPNAVALGHGSFAGEADTVSVGSNGGPEGYGGTPFTRRIVNVAPGLGANDVATFGQLGDAVTGLGGGAGYVGGVFAAPAYALSAPGAAGTYANVGDALSALDSGLTQVNKRVDDLPAGGVGPAGPRGPAGKDGKNGKDGTNGRDGATGAAGKNGSNGKDGKGAQNAATDSSAVHYADAAKSAVTLQSAGGPDVRVSGLADGVQAHDAVTTGQLNRQVQVAIQQARGYADAGDRATLRSAKAYTDWAVRRLDDRFSETQAAQTAQSQMVASFAGADPAHHNRIGAGVGVSGGHGGLAVGYQHADGHVSWNIGGAMAGHERTVGVGAGFSW